MKKNISFFQNNGENNPMLQNHNESELPLKYEDNLEEKIKNSRNRVLSCPPLPPNHNHHKYSTENANHHKKPKPQALVDQSPPMPPHPSL